MASASDPFYDPFCATDEVCFGAGSCVDAVAAHACVPRGCSLAVSCRAELGPESVECAFNVTIDGRTCAIHMGFDLDAGDLRVGGAAQISNGSVDGQPLENVWLAPGGEAYASVLGFDLGYVFVQVYRSDITTEGPRGGIVGLVSPAPDHTWTEIGAAAGHHGGPAYGEDVVVAVEFMDFMPEGCWVRSPSGAIPGFECPRLGPVYALIPLP